MEREKGRVGDLTQPDLVRKKMDVAVQDGRTIGEFGAYEGFAD